MNDTVLSILPLRSPLPIIVAPRMRALGVCAVLLALSMSCQGFGSYRTSFRSSSSSSFGSGQPQPLIQAPPQLSAWAYSHLNEVREFANRLTQEYNAMSSGGSASLAHALAWSGKYYRGYTKNQMGGTSRQTLVLNE